MGDLRACWQRDGRQGPRATMSVRTGPTGQQRDEAGWSVTVAEREIIIDCDPGIDDALALVCAHGSPGLRLRGVTTVAGNVPLDMTTANALRVADFAGIGAWPAVAGSAGPLLRPGRLPGTCTARQGWAARCCRRHRPGQLRGTRWTS